MNAIYKDRLLNVARALRESKNPDMFDMSSFGHVCGTPACAFGHYAARPDLQDVFRLTKVGNPVLLADQASFVWPCIGPHFGLTPYQVNELFEADGCGNAQTANEAADYIERFVAENS